MMRDNYPTTVIEVLDDGSQFKGATLEALRAFAQSSPWSGTRASRMKKSLALNQMLADAEGIRVPNLIFRRIDGSSSGGSYYEPSRHRIVLTGRLSVVTYLHEFAHSLGKGERDACRWSINLFRRCFPKQFARLVHVGHVLIRPEDVGVKSVQ